jgi:hypothetical protein
LPTFAPRRLAVGMLVFAIALLAANAATAGSPAQLASFTPSTVFPAPATVGPAGKLRRALADVTWRGGPIVTSTGETVTVLVSDSLPTVTPEQWAEFIVSLDHGPEISKLTTHVATLDEVQQLCGARALGCYGDDQMISIGETEIDGTTPEEVVRHEYGHHIAFNRSNPPWAAIDWGPKYWASAVGICSRVRHGSAFPGDESVHYDQNPGEAWAETYRVLEERKAGILNSSWQIVSPAFFPNDASLAAALRDVTQPWGTPTAATYRTRFVKKGKKVWVAQVHTLLDGTITLNATLPARGLYDVALLAPNRRTVVKHAVSSGRTMHLSASVCGQRSLYVRVTDRSGIGRVAVTLTTP